MRFFLQTIFALTITLTLFKRGIPINIVGDIDAQSLNSTQAIQITNTNSDSYFYKSMCFCDINGDGIDDLIIGDSLETPPPIPSPLTPRDNAGIVRVIFGTASGFSDLDITTLTSSQGFNILGAVANDGLGTIVACGNDLNGDTIGDLVIGAPNKTTSGFVNAGGAYVIYGKLSGLSDIDLATGLTATQGFIISGTTSNTYLGAALAVADVDNDLNSDLIISAYGAQATRGSVWVLYGPFSGVTTPSYFLGSSPIRNTRINGNTNYDNIGTSLGYAGDINGDSIDDFIIGANSASPSSRTGAGLAYVIYGSATAYPNVLSLSTFTSSQAALISGAAAGDGLGNAVSYAGDINKDGVADIIIAASRASPSSQTSAGCAYIIYGKTGGISDIDLLSLTSSQGFKITGTSAGDMLGTSVTNAGDINFDGTDDVIITSQAFDTSTRTNAGAAYVIFGKAGGWTDTAASDIVIPQGMKIVGDSTSSQLGAAVNYAGDINNDGYNDMFIRALALPGYTGAVYIVYGGPVAYAYWDSSFLPSCNSPLQTRQDTDYVYCDYSCTRISQYLYWNGSCLSTCESPLSYREYKNKLFCDFPCPNSDEYLYWDGSCRDSGCPSPMISEQVGGNMLCKKPCSDDSLYYYPDDQTCRSTCSKPFISTDMEYGKTCSATASEEDVKQMQSIATTLNFAGSVSQNGLFAISIMFPGISVAAVAGSLSRLITYTRYLNITATPRLKILFNNTDPFADGLPFVPDIPSGVRDAYDYQAVPVVFSRYKLSGSFLVNYWSALLSIALVSGITIVFLVMEHIVKQTLQQQHIVWRITCTIRVIAQNFTLIQVYEALGELVFFSCLEFQTQIIGPATFNLSLALAIVCFILGLSVLGFHFYLLVKYQRTKRSCADGQKSAEVMREFKEKYAGFKILFHDFHDRSFFLQAFLLFFTLRDVSFQFILILLYPSYIAQTVLIIIPSAAILIYLYKKLPYREIPDLLQAMALEIVFLVVNVSLFEFTLFDVSDIGYSSTQYVLGEIIIYCSLLCHFIPIFFILVKLIVLAIRHRSTLKVLGMNVLVYTCLTKPPADLGRRDVRVYPASPDANSPAKLLTNVESPPSKSKPPEPRTQASITSIEPLSRKSASRPTIARILVSERDPLHKGLRRDSRDLKSQLHLGDEFKESDKSGLRLDSPADSPPKYLVPPQKSDTMFTLDKLFEDKHDKRAPSSRNRLLGESKKAVKEEEEVRLVVDSTKRKDGL